MGRAFNRTERLGEQMRRELAAAVPTLLNHPHAAMVSFTAVRLTRDLSYAKVYFTFVLDDPSERQALGEALNRHAGAFRHYLAQRLSTRKVPELSFYYDESIEYGARMDALLSRLVKPS